MKFSESALAQVRGAFRLRTETPMTIEANGQKSKRQTLLGTRKN